MTEAHYYLPEITRYDEVYTLQELREFFQRGELNRSDIATDDQSGITYLIGDLLETLNFRPQQGRNRSEFEEEDFESGEEDQRPIEREFRGDIPLKNVAPRPPASLPDEEGMETYDTRPFLSAEDEESGDAKGEAEEYCLFEGHPSWWSYPRLILFVMIGIASVTICVLMGVGFEWWLFLGAITGLLAAFISLHRITTTYVVTNKRVEWESGLIGSNSKEVRIIDIRAMDVTQKGWEPVLGIGTIHFDSSATMGPEVTFRNVRAPHEIKKIIRELQV